MVAHYLCLVAHAAKRPTRCRGVSLANNGAPAFHGQHSLSCTCCTSGHTSSDGVLSESMTCDASAAGTGWSQAPNQARHHVMQQRHRTRIALQHCLDLLVCPSSCTCCTLDHCGLSKRLVHHNQLLSCGLPAVSKNSTSHLGLEGRLEGPGRRRDVLQGGVGHGVR